MGQKEKIKRENGENAKVDTVLRQENEKTQEKGSQLGLWRNHSTLTINEHTSLSLLFLCLSVRPHLPYASLMVVSVINKH